MTKAMIVCKEMTIVVENLTLVDETCKLENWCMLAFMKGYQILCLLQTWQPQILVTL